MDASPTTRKVVFSILAIVLTLIGLALSQPNAEALTGYRVRTFFGVPTVIVRANPSYSAIRAYTLPNGAAIDIKCKLLASDGNNWLQLSDGNFLSQANSSYPASSNVLPICTQTKIYADRSILQANGPAVYIIQSGKILWIPNEETLNTCLGGYGRVTHVADADLSEALKTYPNGGTASCPVNYANGTTLLAQGGGTVYVVSNGALYGVPTPEVLIACLGGWPVVKTISQAQMAWTFASYTYDGTYNCPPVAYAQDTLLKGSGPGVYLVHSGSWYGIPSPDVLMCYGGWPAVHYVSDAEILRLTISYPGGATAGCRYSLADGSKLLAPSGTVFYLHGGVVYGMPSANVLISCYGGWAGVRSASQAEIDAMFATYPYGGAAGCAPPPPPPVPTAGEREQHAIDWAKAQLGSTGWNGLCELMVEQAYNTQGKYGSALINANAKTAAGQMHAGDTNVPAGALAFFGAATVNGGYGHVMISIGNGQFISNGYTWGGVAYGARITTIAGVGGGPYLGWAYADSGWPGR